MDYPKFIRKNTLFNKGLMVLIFISVFRASTLSPGSGHMVQLQKKVRSLEDENLTLKLEVRKASAVP